MKIQKLASAIYNDIISGLAGVVNTPTMSMQQLEDEVVLERLMVIKEFILKNILPKHDLLQTLSCIDIDKESLDKCCVAGCGSRPVAHFEVPQLLNDFTDHGIDFIGSIDKNIQFKVYFNTMFRSHKKKMVGGCKPYVYIDPTPNKNNKYDGYIFNAPLLKRLSVIGIFKDPRQLEDYACCLDDDNLSVIDKEIIDRMIKKKLAFYRQYIQQNITNNQVPQ